MSNGTSYVYDPSTGSWVPQSPTAGSAPSSSSSSPENVPSSSTGNDSGLQIDSKSEADKEYIEVEFNTLTGELAVVPSKKNIRIKVNDTIEALGLGNNLSGKYFVSSIKRTINKDSGYSQTLTVLKNGFGDSLKKPSEVATDIASRASIVDKSAPTLKVGDSVRVVGDAIYTNGEKISAWVKNDSNLKVQQISSDGSRVLLAPILSWTYSRYVQKV